MTSTPDPRRLPSGGAVPEGAEGDLDLLGAAVGEKMGLHFPPERRGDLWRAVRDLARETKAADARSLLAFLAAHPLSEELTERLAPHLTVGETYFFRERKSLEAFRKHVLPEYLARGRLRVWCAGCSSGEEPYTVAMLVHEERLPERTMALRVLGTDINPRALEKARRGVYSRWSFRGMSEEFRQKYFDPASPQTFAVKPRFREEVSFSLHNLVGDKISPWHDAEPVDVIFCRNVLIYFAPATIALILDRFYRLLAPGGWLLVAPCETSILLASRFSSVSCLGATLYRKGSPDSGVASVFPMREFPALDPMFPDDVPDDRGAWNGGVVSPRRDLPELLAEAWGDGGASAPEEAADLRDSASDPEERWDAAAALGPLEEPGCAPSPEEPPEDARVQEAYAGGRWSDAENVLRSLGVTSTERQLLMARIQANQGKYAEALEWCHRALEGGKSDPRIHYLLASLRQEMGEAEEAMRALRSALFLDPDFVAAHYALGTLALAAQRAGDARRHFRNALTLLSRMPEEEEMPESGGMTARHLLQTLRNLEQGGALGE